MGRGPDQFPQICGGVRPDLSKSFWATAGVPFAVLGGCFVVQCSIALRIEAGEGDEDEQHGSGSGPVSQNVRGAGPISPDLFGSSAVPKSFGGMHI